MNFSPIICILFVIFTQDQFGISHVKAETTKEIINNLLNYIKGDQYNPTDYYSGHTTDIEALRAGCRTVTHGRSPTGTRYDGEIEKAKGKIRQRRGGRAGDLITQLETLKTALRDGIELQ